MSQDYFKKMRSTLRYWLQGAGYFKALEAMEFAEQYHKGKRKDGFTPEFHHQIGIMQFLRTLLPSIREANREAILIAAALHDLTEDYDVRYSDVATKFGHKIANIVSKLDRYKEVGKRKKTSEVYYGELGSCPVASLVKGADRINNFQSMNGVFTPEKQLAYIKECEEYILPMLKNARRSFPDQEPVYENIKYVLRTHIAWVRSMHEKDM